MSQTTKHGSWSLRRQWRMALYRIGWSFTLIGEFFTNKADAIGMREWAEKQWAATHEENR